MNTTLHSHSKPAIVTAVGGLGNRLRAIDSAFYLCKTVNRPLKVFWFNEWNVRARFRDLFDPILLPGVTLKDGSFPEYLLYGPSYAKRNYLIPLFCQRIRFGRRRMFSMQEGYKMELAGIIPSIFQKTNQTVFCTCGSRIAPPPADYKLFSIFHPISPIMDIVNNLTALFPQNGCVGIHVRRGDNLQSTRNSPTNLFIKRMDHLLDSGCCESFYLATDSEHVRSELLTRYGRHVIFNEGDPSRFTNNGMRNGVIDMWTLSRCKEIYGSDGSTFSLTASEIGEIPHHIVAMDPPPPRSKKLGFVDSLTGPP